MLLNMDVTLEEYSITKHSKKGAARYHIPYIYKSHIRARHIEVYVIFTRSIFVLYITKQIAYTARFTRHVKKIVKKKFA